MADLRHVPHTEGIDLTLLIDEDCADYLKHAMQFASEMLSEAFMPTDADILPPYVHMPIIWSELDGCGDGMGGPPVEDPTTLYVHLPLSGYDCETVFAVSLTEIVAEEIDDTNGFSEDPEVGKKLANSLRALADQIEAALPPEAE